MTDALNTSEHLQQISVNLATRMPRIVTQSVLANPVLVRLYNEKIEKKVQADEAKRQRQAEESPAPEDYHRMARLAREWMVMRYKGAGIYLEGSEGLHPWFISHKNRDAFWNTSIQGCVYPSERRPLVAWYPAIGRGGHNYANEAATVAHEMSHAVGCPRVFVTGTHNPRLVYTRGLEKMNHITALEEALAMQNSFDFLDDIAEGRFRSDNIDVLHITGAISKQREKSPMRLPVDIEWGAYDARLLNHWSGWLGIERYHQNGATALYPYEYLAAYNYFHRVLGTCSPQDQQRIVMCLQRAQVGAFEELYHVKGMLKSAGRGDEVIDNFLNMPFDYNTIMRAMMKL